MIFILGFFFISIFGTLLHFLYDISNHNKIIGIFAAVNESTWEHIKMALSASFLWSIFDAFYYINNPNYFTAKLICLLSIIILIPLIFYSYKSITKKPILIIDILTFYVAIFFSMLNSYLIITYANIPPIINFISLILFFFIFFIFLLFTKYPPNTFIFKDPLTNEYGYKGHK